MALTVKQLDAAEFDAWDAFVTSQPAATFCHLAGWKTVIEQGAGQDCPYLLALQDGSVVGVLPLSVKKHPIFGKALISNMFCVYGGAVAVDKDVERALYDGAWAITQQLGLTMFENRSVIRHHADDENWIEAAQSATFSRDLDENDEAQLLAVPRKQRAVIRKSLKNELQTDWNGNLNVFYDLYAHSVLSLGTPVFPRKLFAAMVDVFGDAVETQITRTADGTGVASLMSFYFRDTVMPYYAGGTSEVRRLAAHDFMYFQLMLHARERGFSKFDFGRSKIDSGPYKFKKNWGFEPVELGYEIRLKPGAEAPNLSQQSGPFAILSKIWKKLPLGVSKILGPPLARHLG